MSTNISLLLFLLLYYASTSTASSGCSECESTGNCQSAYHHAPGQYCGRWYDNSAFSAKQCCCPLNTICKLSPFSCMCHVPGPGEIPHPRPSNNKYHDTYHTGGGGGYHQNTDYTRGDIGSPVAGTLALFAIVACVWCCCCRKTEHYHHGEAESSIPVAYAVPTSNPTYYGSASTSNGGGGGGNFGSAFGGVGSALGGVAVGTLLGNLMGNRRDHGNFGGGGGGYDISGESGFVQPSAPFFESPGGGGGGYDIAGDSGGGDFSGDSGGGDFRGDS